MKKLLFLLALALSALRCVPLTAMNETKLKGVEKTPIEAISHFGTIHNPKKTTPDTLEKQKKLKAKFLAHNTQFFSQPQDPIEAKKWWAERCSEQYLYGTTITDKIVLSTLVQLRNYLTTTQELDGEFANRPWETWGELHKKLDAINIKQKIIMLTYADFMEAPHDFLMQLAWGIQRDIKKDKKLYLKYRNELESCTFKPTRTQWVKTGELRKQMPSEFMTGNQENMQEKESTITVTQSTGPLICGNLMIKTIGKAEEFTKTHIFLNDGLKRPKHYVNFVSGLFKKIQDKDGYLNMYGNGLLHFENRNGQGETIIEAATGEKYNFETDYSISCSLINKQLIVCEYIRKTIKGKFETQPRYHLFTREAEVVPLTTWLSQKNTIAGGTHQDSEKTILAKKTAYWVAQLGGVTSLAVTTVAILNEFWLRKEEPSSLTLGSYFGICGILGTQAFPLIYGQLSNYLDQKLDIRP